MRNVLPSATLFLLAACRPTVPPEDDDGLVCGPGTHEEAGACVPDADTGVDDSGDTGGADTTDTGGDPADTGDTAQPNTDTGNDSGSGTEDSGGDTGGDDTAGTEASPGDWSGEYELGDDASILEPDHAGDYLGWSIDVNGDADGDGEQDLLVSALGADPNGDNTGSTYVWATGVASDGLIDDARLRIDGDTDGNWTGYQALFLPDADGDGADEIILSNVPRACSAGSGTPGSVGVFSGTHTGTVDFSDGDAIWASDDLGDLFGCGVASPGDLDGDGNADLAVGGGGNSDAAASAGVAYLFADPLAGGAASSATTRLYTTVANLRLGSFMGTVGDTDGDGLPEVGVGFRGPLGSGDTPSGVYIVGDPGAGDFYIDDVALGVVLPETSSSSPQLGGGYSNPIAAAGDVDGDGYGDAVVGAPEANNYEGAAYLVSGPLSGDQELFFATARISGTVQYSLVGYAVRSAHDVDGDGRDDIAIGAPGYAEHGNYSGAVGIFFSPAGELEFEDASATAYGDATNWYAAYDLAISDQTRDGVDDLVVGAVYAPDFGQDAGLVAVLPGGI